MDQEKNVNIDEKNNKASISLNSRIYPLDVIHFATYMLMEKATVIIEGDPDKELLVKINIKDNKSKIRNLVEDFFSELSNYSVYKIMSEKNKDIKEMLLQRALYASSPEIVNDLGKEPKNGAKENQNEDPEKILAPWNEKENQR